MQHAAWMINAGLLVDQGERISLGLGDDEHGELWGATFTFSHMPSVSEEIEAAISTNEDHIRTPPTSVNTFIDPATATGVVALCRANSVEKTAVGWNPLWCTFHLPMYGLEVFGDIVFLVFGNVAAISILVRLDLIYSKVRSSKQAVLAGRFREGRDRLRR